MNKKLLLLCLVVLWLWGTPRVSADTARPKITAGNIAQLKPLRLLSRGKPWTVSWTSDGKNLIVNTRRGLWVYATDDFYKAPRYLETKDDLPLAFWQSPDGELLRRYQGSPTKLVIDGKSINIAGGSLIISDNNLYAAYVEKQQSHLLNLKTGKEVGAIKGWPIVFSPDEKTLVTQIDKNNLQFWRTDFGTHIRSQHSSVNLNFEMFSPDSTLFLLSETDFRSTVAWPQASLWSLKTSKRLTSFPIGGHPNFSANGKYIAYDAVAPWESSLNPVIYNLMTQKDEPFEAEIQVLRRYIPYWSCVSFVRGDKLVIRNMVTGAEHLLPASQAQYIDNLSPDLAYRVAIEGDNSIYVVDTTTNDPVAVLKDYSGDSSGDSFRTHDGSFQASQVIRFSPDGKYIFVQVTGQNGIKVWNLEQNAPPLTMGVNITPPFTPQYRVLQAVFSADSKLLITLSAANDKKPTLIQYWNIETGQEAKRFEIKRTGLFMSPDATTLAFIADNKLVQLWDSARATPIAALDVCAVEFALWSFSPNSRYFACTGRNLSCPTIHVWDAQTGKHLWQSAECGDVGRIFFSDDSRILANTSSNAGNDAIGEIWDTGTGKGLLSLQARTIDALSPDGALALVAPKDYQHTSVIDIQSGKELVTVSLPKVSSRGIALTSDNTLFITRNADYPYARTGDLNFWEIPTGKIRFTFPNGGAFAFSPDGTLLAISDGGGAIQLFGIGG